MKRGALIGCSQSNQKQKNKKETAQTTKHAQTMTNALNSFWNGMDTVFRFMGPGKLKN